MGARGEDMLRWIALWFRAAGSHCVAGWCGIADVRVAGSFGVNVRMNASASVAVDAKAGPLGWSGTSLRTRCARFFFLHSSHPTEKVYTSGSFHLRTRSGARCRLQSQHGSTSLPPSRSHHQPVCPPKHRLRRAHSPSASFPPRGFTLSS